MPTVKGKNGKIADYSEGPTPEVTAINKARAENIANGRGAYEGAGATTLSASKGKGGYKPTIDYDLPDFSEENATKRINEGGAGGIFTAAQLKGKRPSEQKSMIEGLKTRAKTQTALTTGAFNPATVSGARKIFEGFNLKLNETNNDSWTSKGTKKEKAAGLYEATANEYARLFQSPEEFDSLLTADADFAAGIDAFKRAGGDVNAIRTRIGRQMQEAPVDQERASQRAAIQGLIDQGVTNTEEIAAALNEAGRASGVNSAFTSDEVMRIMTGKNEQSTTDYLSSLSTSVDPNASDAERQAMDELIPERELAQAEVARIANIPQQYKDLYFGTPESIGILQEKRILAEEQKKIIERQERADETSLRAKADLAIDKNNADMEIESAQIEENRLAARNYATGMLSKLGALNTTGAAPVKLATIEQKYQQQSQQLRSATKFANRGIEINLKEAVANVEIQADQDILDVQSDLTKDKEEVMKEVQKIEQDAASKIYGITDKAASELRVNRVKYIEKAKKLAEKNAKEAAEALSAYDTGTWGKKITGGTEAERKAKRLAQYQEVFSPGVVIEDGIPTLSPDGNATFDAWKEAMKEAPAMGLTRKEFIENFGYLLLLDKDGKPDKGYGLTPKEAGYLE